eukprot:TRINITY_DN3872_c0_g2_i1.p1 TRINITY_DN3872_c0_g2~~TRINITY_DN3872_c0_g2_i1.p1  ORF type:complete len:195 (-),score=42.32 TRINITY_DN3872_c0_g2_i1:93-635(-)
MNDAPSPSDDQPASPLPARVRYLPGRGIVADIVEDESGISSELVEKVMGSCAVKAPVSAVVGGAMGYAFGAFFGSGVNNMEHLNPDAPKISNWQHVKNGFRDANTRGLRMGRGFALAGGVYVACECVVEKGRGKADIWNALYGGCLAGAVLAGKSGPTGIAMGCGGFALFSGAIEVFMME